MTIRTDNTVVIVLRLNGHQIWTAALLLERTGIRSLGFLDYGFRHVYNRKRQISSPSDLSGLKLRVLQSRTYISAYEEFGVQATPMNYGEVYSAMQQGVIDGDSVAALHTKGAAPIVLQLTCLTGLFAHPTIASLSEDMLLGDEGPVAIMSATSLSLSDHQRPFGAAFLRAIQDPEVMRVGDAFQSAKRELRIESIDALQEISDTFTLFGDPSTLIRRPGQ